MNEVSSFRLYVLRALYLFIVAGLCLLVWPGIIHESQHWEFMEGTVSCMLAAFSLLCALGLRYPLQMLPILLWEALWKTIWLSIVALPQILSGHIDAPQMSAIVNCSFVVLVYLTMPWRYVYKHYVLKSADPWSPPFSGRTVEAAQ
ncbi:hypothetical protein SAMN04515618_116111 [Collimonas sp. OK307]|uniref:hypothetical protein n=1 Tax=Collimonas sp. OK307 TaxID=1801620 RepID=UPI0008E8EECD|nr:hypothetical protein [Collimonas sp. OK307]SFI30088.1 hypothetical protein SAMN04515618_116111 [Collimonas sp. OK307]